MSSYRLEPLVKVRRGKVDAAARELSHANAQAAAQEQARRDVDREKARHEQAAHAVLEAERAALVEGHLTGSDLRHRAEWKVCVDDEQRLLAKQLVEREAEEQKAKAAADRARVALASRRSDARLLEDHRDAWTAQTRRDAESQTEEEIADIHASRRPVGP